MRVALVQIRLDQTSRADRIQAILAGIRRAVDTEAAPDLVVLPGGCDGDAGARDEARWTVSEAIAHEAREWGVFIAAGLRCGTRPCALLFDADGDIAARSPGDPSAEQRAGASDVGFYDSPYGVMGVVEPSSTSLSQACASKLVPEMIVAVPVSMAQTELSAAGRRNTEPFLNPKSAEIGDAHWVVVRPAQPKQAKQTERSVLWAPGGSALAATDGSGEAVVCVDVPVAPSIVR